MKIIVDNFYRGTYETIEHIIFYFCFLQKQSKNPQCKKKKRTNLYKEAGERKMFKYRVRNSLLLTKAAFISQTQ